MQLVVTDWSCALHRRGIRSLLLLPAVLSSSLHELVPLHFNSVFMSLCLCPLSPIVDPQFAQLQSQHLNSGLQGHSLRSFPSLSSFLMISHSRLQHLSHMPSIICPRFFKVAVAHDYKHTMTTWVIACHPPGLHP